MSKTIQFSLGLVFLSAAVFRIFNYPAAIEEMNRLALPGALSILVIVLELTIATCFLAHKFVKYASLLAVIFLVIPIGLSFLLHPKEIVAQLADLFVFNITATDVVLHVVFLILVLLIYKTERRNKG